MASSTVQSIEIDAPREAVFAVASAVGEYPDWATGIRTVEVHETDGDGRPLRASFVVDGMVKEISYTLVYTYDEPQLMSWVAEPGDDITEMEGSYTFKPLDADRTEVVYALRAEPAFTIPGFLRRQVEKQIVGTALRGLRSRVETLASG
jgi:uncharacterized membrane protein